MVTPAESFAQRVSSMAYLLEIRNARQLGYSNLAAYISALCAADDTFDLVMAPMPEITTGRFRP